MKEYNNALRLNPAANESIINMLETQVGVMLPQPLRHFFKLADGAKTPTPMVMSILLPRGIKRFCFEGILSINDIIGKRRKSLDIPSHILTIAEDKALNKLLIDLVRGHILFMERILIPQSDSKRPSKLKENIVIFESFEGLIQFLSQHQSQPELLFIRPL